MAGRPPKPTKLLELTGAVRKNPGRYKNRDAEPESPSQAIGDPPSAFMVFHPAEGYLKAEKLRSIWDNCVKMWPWVTFSDRDALEMYCRLKLKVDDALARDRRLQGADVNAMLRICSELGGTGSGRARLGVRAAGEKPKAKKSADPRVAFLAQKCG